MTVQHVVPTDDLIDHDSHSFGACVCGPDATPIVVTATCGQRSTTDHVGWVVIHHSLDGREVIA